MGGAVKKRQRKPSSTAKGRVVETLAAWFHDWPGVEVEKNVRLPALHDPARHPEIDVLLTTSVAGYPVRIAIECKNEKAPIGTPYINGFIGKLDDVGIPRQQGVFVSASRYTKGAVKRAEKEGIRTLLLQGLSADGLKASITMAAYQSIIFFVVVVDSVSLLTKSPSSPAPLFIDDRGALCGTVPHLITAKWQQAEISTKPGSYDLALDVPAGWRVLDTGTGRPGELFDQKVHVKLRVFALAVTTVGKAEEYSLVDAPSNRLEKHGVKVFFDTPERRYPVRVFAGQADLEDYLNARKGFKITHRVKVPRIRYHTAYWPLSRRAADHIRELSSTPTFKNGELQFPSLEEVEGFDLAAAWEEPMSLQEFDEFFLTAHRAPDPA